MNLHQIGVVKKLGDYNQSLSSRQREAYWGFFFISPWIIGFLAFSLYPILSVFYLSFTEYTVLQPSEWIGLANYVEMFTGDRLFFKSLYNTFYYLALRVPGWLVVGLLLAMLLNRKTFGIGWFRTAFYLPTIIPVVAGSIIWMWLLNPQVGLINPVFREAGIFLPNWFRDVTWAKPAMVTLAVWQVGQTMIIFLAGLQEIPKQLYEAARIDGSSAVQTFFNITLPMMTPTIYFNLVIGVISAFQVFGVAFVITNGGPEHSTLFYVLYLYRRAFEFLNMGYASAMAVILFIIVLALTALLVKTSDRWVQYERI